MWPTWADIIADDLCLPLQNWGVSGIGNIAIFSRMLECDLKNKFTDSDLILVNWSSWHREDRVEKVGDWHSGGNIFNNPFYGNSFIKRYWTEKNDIIKNSTAIISANRMFNINYQSHMIDYEGRTEYNETSYDFSGYEVFLENMPKKIIFDSLTNSRFNKTIADHHPDILCHLNHVRNIYKELGLFLNTTTVEKYINMQRRVIEAATLSNRVVNKNFESCKNFFQTLNLKQLEIK
jgi:hypothetical protein